MWAVCFMHALGVKVESVGQDTVLCASSTCCLFLVTEGKTVFLPWAFLFAALLEGSQGTFRYDGMFSLRLLVHFQPGTCQTSQYPSLNEQFFKVALFKPLQYFWKDVSFNCAKFAPAWQYFKACIYCRCWSFAYFSWLSASLCKVVIGKRSPWF